MVLTCLSGRAHVHALGVFDGHRGPEAARYASRHLPALLERCLGSYPDISSALTACFLLLDHGFRSEARPADRYPGCTALVALFAGPRLYLANAGDCRAVLCRGGVAEALTRDHSAADDSERTRVAAAGCQVQWRQDGWRLGEAGLQVTRSLGDADLKPAVTAEPEITTTELRSDAELLLVCSDGVWDAVRGNQAAVDLAQATVKDPTLIAKRIVFEAMARGSRDNATCCAAVLGSATTAECIFRDTSTGGSR